MARVRFITETPVYRALFRRQQTLSPLCLPNRNFPSKRPQQPASEIFSSRCFSRTQPSACATGKPFSRFTGYSIVLTGLNQSCRSILRNGGQPSASCPRTQARSSNLLFSVVYGVACLFCAHCAGQCNRPFVDMIR